MAHCVRLIEYAPEITLIFCLRHRCTKNQVLQVFGRIEQEFNGSETLQVSPPKLNFGGRSAGLPASLYLRKINFVKFQCSMTFTQQPMESSPSQNSTSQDLYGIN